MIRYGKEEEGRISQVSGLNETERRRVKVRREVLERKILNSVL